MHTKAFDPNLWVESTIFANLFPSDADATADDIEIADLYRLKEDLQTGEYDDELDESRVIQAIQACDDMVAEKEEIE